MHHTNKKLQVHNLIILDESGSMAAIKSTIIQGFNELVQTVQGIEQQFPDQEHLISLVSFNGMGQKTWHFREPVATLHTLNDHLYAPNATTPLFDAMGNAIHRLKQSLQGQDNYHVLVTILTDGEENSSTEFTGPDIKQLVEKLKQNNWTFTYIGTDHDIDKITTNLSIDNSMLFSKSDEGIDRMFALEMDARMLYSQKIDLDLDTSNYYHKPTEEAEDK